VQFANDSAATSRGAGEQRQQGNACAHTNFRLNNFFHQRGPAKNNIRKPGRVTVFARLLCKNLCKNGRFSPLPGIRVAKSRICAIYLEKLG
jgi:hypothetical protein